MGGGEGMEVEEERDYIPIVHCYRQNDFCIKMGSDQSHFNALSVLKDKVARQCP